MENIKIRNVLNKLYSPLILSEWMEYEGLLYYYIKDKFDLYKKLVAEINENEFSIEPESIFFKGNITKTRLNNLVERIVEGYMSVLQFCYKGDFYFASRLLYRILLCQNSKLHQYLIEPYINYLDFEILGSSVFYRMRDEKNGNPVDNCSHVPFNKICCIDSNRFSLQGLPCLYLADSHETANRECREVNEGYQRWVSEFVPVKQFAFTDLRFRGLKIDSNIDIYDAFRLIITFPIRFLCSFRVKADGDKFHEEYLFPQLLSHLILVYLKGHSEDKLYNGSEGIMYDSTQNEKGFNVIIPALYSEKEPPQSGHSSKISELFREQNITLCK